MRNDNINITLAHKGIALVAILLAMELLFVGTLTQLLHESQRRADDLLRSRTIMLTTQRLMQHAAMVSLSFDKQSFAAGFFSQEVQLAEHEIPRLFRELEVMVKDKPDRLRTLRVAESPMNDAMDVAVKVRASLIGGHFNVLALGDIGFDRIKKVLSNYRTQAVPALFDFLNQEQSLEQGKESASAHSRAELDTFLLGGVVFNIVIAVAAAIAFARSITNRLQRIVANTFRVAKHEPLLPVCQGTDEIAYLDRTFHDMAKVLQETEEKERRLQQIKERLIAIASHELRGPLTSVVCALDTVMGGVYGAIPPKVAEATQRASENLTRLIEVIDELLDLEKLKLTGSQPTYRQVSTDEITRKATIAVSDLALKKNIDIECDDDNSYVINVDEGRIVQVLINLLSNAIKFSPSQSAVYLSVSQEDDCVKFSVRDSGKGITPEEQSRIFKPFGSTGVQADFSLMKGTGLGLSISKDIVEDQNGEIGVSSARDAGSIFWFKIPRDRSAVLSIDNAPEQPISSAMIF